MPTACTVAQDGKRHHTAYTKAPHSLYHHEDYVEPFDGMAISPCGDVDWPPNLCNLMPLNIFGDRLIPIKRKQLIPSTVDIGNSTNNFSQIAVTID